MEASYRTRRSGRFQCKAAIKGSSTKGFELMEDLAPIVEEEEIQDDKPEAPPSLRDSLASALEESKAKADLPEKEPKTEAKPDRPRDDTGKFAKEEKQKRIKETVSHESNAEVAKIETTLPVPKSFPATHSKDWASLPRPMQELIAKREDDFHRELTKHDEERNFGRQVQALAAPYLPLIRAEGGDLTKGFEQYLNTAYNFEDEISSRKRAINPEISARIWC